MLLVIILAILVFLQDIVRVHRLNLCDIFHNSAEKAELFVIIDWISDVFTGKFVVLAIAGFAQVEGDSSCSLRKISYKSMHNAAHEYGHASLYLANFPVFLHYFFDFLLK